MKDPYSYQLEPYRGPATRHTCPKCGKRRQFVRYIHTITREPLGQQVGRCNREQKCAYHYTPKQFFADQKIMRSYRNPPPIPRTPKLVQCHQPSYIPLALLKATLKNYEANHLITYLQSRLGHDKIQQLIAQFYIGTSKHWPGATIFWQIDSQGYIRTGKIMLYDPLTGRRIKKPFSHVTWVHHTLKLTPFQVNQTLFGAHQLCQPTSHQPVALVESEKTAIIATAYWPNFLWMATGSLTGLTPERCACLQGRKVILFPDAGAYLKWKQSAEQLISQLGIYVKVSNWLEQQTNTGGLTQGLDLADYLAQRPYPE
jgi:hypothetical protein